MAARNRQGLVVWVLVLAFSVLACASSSRTSKATATPASDSGSALSQAATLTAVFAPSGNGLATATPIPVEQTDTDTETNIDAGEGSSGEAGTDDNILGEEVVYEENGLSEGPLEIVLPTLIPVPTADALSLEFDLQATPATTEQRYLPSVLAFYQSQVPQIDGDPGDWSGVWYATDHIVFGQEFHAGRADLSGEFKLGWDADFLYIAVAVRDTKFVQNAGAAQLYQGDSIEILLDTDVTGDFSEQVLNGDDFQIGVSPGNLLEHTAPEVYIWAPENKAGPVSRVLIGARLTEEGYLMEVAIPWFVLEVTPFADLHLGFLFSISDNDAVGQNVQQSVASYVPRRILYNPTTWNDLRLVQP